MKSNLLTEYRVSYIQKRRTELDFLSNIQIPEFQTLAFSCCNIDVEGKYIDELVKQLDLYQDSKILYYLEIKSGHTAAEIIKLVAKEKAKKRTKVKLPLVNKANDESRILYVGKTNSNFSTRFTTHVSLKNASTYALHLEHWARDISLDLTLHYAVVDLVADSIQYLEQLESILHESLYPVLGRSGH